ncbi:hypothetical protein [Niallia sp. RD1]|nr:hypothetical protein [Niallia sp. RD1]UTI44404.1 hypothetical protein NKG37_12740 [Niallia sp. RD1]
MSEMNAAQMRKKSTANQHKVAVANLEQFINRTNEIITSKANDGHFSYITPVPGDPLWNDFKLTKSLVNYYKDRGFQVSVIDLLLSVTLKISWLEEEEELHD